MLPEDILKELKTITVHNKDIPLIHVLAALLQSVLGSPAGAEAVAILMELLFEYR